MKTPLEESISTENIFYDLYHYVEEKVTSVISFALNPFLNVSEKGMYVYIRNIPTTKVINDIKNGYGGYVSNHIFKESDDNTIVIHRYFLPELVHILSYITSHQKDPDDPKDKDMTTSKYTLTRVIKKLHEDTWLRDTVKKHRPIIDFNAIKKNLLWDPLPHQQDFLDYYNEKVPKFQLRGSLFSGAAGSGKTYTALAVAEGRGAELVIIVSPKNALNTVWESTVKEQYVKKPQPTWVIGDSAAMERVKNLRYVIINYDQLKGNLKTMKAVAKGKQVLVVLDESHNFNTLTSKRTALFLDLIESIKPEDTLFLSGTPIKALASEALPLLKSVTSDMTDEVVDIARKVYRSYDVIQHRLGMISYTVEKKELKLKDPISHEITVDFKEKEDYTLSAVKEKMLAYTEKQLSYYAKTQAKDRAVFFSILNIFSKSLKDDALKEFDYYLKTVKQLINHSGDYTPFASHMKLCNIYELDTVIPSLTKKDQDTFKAIRSQVKYVELKVQGEVLGRVVSKMRVECHAKMAGALAIDEIIESAVKKTLVFASNIEILEAINKQCVDLGYNTVQVYGKEVKNLKSAVKEFHRNDEVNPLIASYPALSTAVPITVASNVVILDYPFRDYILNQAISRAHRIGQDEQVNVYYIRVNTSEPNISDRSYDIITWAQREVERITGVDSPIDLERAQIENGKDFAGYTAVSTTDKLVANFINRNNVKSNLNNW